jgi:hypothetical protein
MESAELDLEAPAEARTPDSAHRQALRRRLLKMILRNEALRQARRRQPADRSSERPVIGKPSPRPKNKQGLSTCAESFPEQGGIREGKPPPERNPASGGQRGPGSRSNARELRDSCPDAARAM